MIDYMNIDDMKKYFDAVIPNAQKQVLPIEQFCVETREKKSYDVSGHRYINLLWFSAWMSPQNYSNEQENRKRVTCNLTLVGANNNCMATKISFLIQDMSQMNI